MANEVATLQLVSDVIKEQNNKLDNIDQCISDFNDAVSKLKSAACVSGEYSGSVLDREPYVNSHKAKVLIMQSAWQRVFRICQLAYVMPSRDQQDFEMGLEKPVPVTMVAVKATFGDYLLNARYHILRGLAEVFTRLDDSYKSHSKVAVGVKGLPKRVIFYYPQFGSYRHDTLKDMLNALFSYRNEPLLEHAELSAIKSYLYYNKTPDFSDEKYQRLSLNENQELEFAGCTFRYFQNQNLHVHFDKSTLREINLALAEFYGDVLPDVESDEEQPKRQSTSVAKDLQYYPTPKEAAERLIGEAGISEGYEVLEPSCGCGRLLDQLPTNCNAMGIEFDRNRADIARRKGHSVFVANFLEVTPTPKYDRVVMNPPFYGKHYLKHIMHAMDFLKPGGRLVAILPASAWYDHKLLPKGRWIDLPIGSFRESGTNVSTGIFISDWK